MSTPPCPGKPVAPKKKRDTYPKKWLLRVPVAVSLAHSWEIK